VTSELAVVKIYLPGEVPALAAKHTSEDLEAISLFGSAGMVRKLDAWLPPNENLKEALETVLAPK